MKIFSQKFIGVFTLLLTSSFTINAQDCASAIQSTADAYLAIINQVQATSDGYWTDLQICNSASYANEIYLSNCNSDKAEIQSDLDAANQQIISLQSQLNNVLTQADVDAAYAAGAASVTPEDGISQADVDAAYAAGAASVTPEDGISQADVDAAYAAGVASVTPEDGVSQVDVNNAIAGATPLEVNIPAELPQGWSMLGYTCLESLDVVEAFSSLSDKIEIVKDEWGLAYLPAWSFSAFDNLDFGEGYQIKMIEEVTDFSFCSTLKHKVLGCTDQTAFNFNEAANTDDGSCIPVISGCTDELAVNYDASANQDDDSCIIVGCTETSADNYNASANQDDGSCIIVGCTNPEASNYASEANKCANDWDCECTYETYGCTDSAAINYSSEATINKGCVYQLPAGPNCSSLEILSTVTNVFDNLPSGISVQDEVSFNIDLKSSEWSAGSDQNNDDFFYDEISIGSNSTHWQAAQPVQYVISYSSGYSESGQITSIRVVDGGVNLYTSTYFYNQGGDWIMDWTDGQDKIEFYDGDTKIYDMQMGGDANLSYASNIGDVALALTNTYVSGTFYWANYQVDNYWTTYHQDHATEQGSASFSVTELDCNSSTAP